MPAPETLFLFLKKPAAIFYLFLLLSTACHSIKEPYLFKPELAETLTYFSATIEATEIPNNHPSQTNKTVAFPAQKVRINPQNLLASDQTGKAIKATVPVKGMKAAEPEFNKLSLASLPVGNQPKQALTHVRQKFPVVWFIILSTILAGLLIAYAASNKGYPPVEGVYLLLMIPFAIPWLLILAKALAPGYGFFLFVAMVVAIILLILFIDWLSRIQQKARRNRYQREQKKKQLEREQAP